MLSDLYFSNGQIMKRRTWQGFGKILIVGESELLKTMKLILLLLAKEPWVNIPVNIEQHYSLFWF